MRELKSLRHFKDRSIYSRGVGLIRKTQGENAVADTHVEDYANGNLSEAFGMFESEVLIAVATAKIESHSASPIFARLKPVLSPLSLNDRIGYLRTLSVEPTFQRSGIGSALTLARLNWFRERGCTRAFAISWSNGLQNNSGQLFRTLNFNLVERIEGFYRDALFAQKAICAVCGPSCECAAEVFYKDL